MSASLSLSLSLVFVCLQSIWHLMYVLQRKIFSLSLSVFNLTPIIKLWVLGVIGGDIWGILSRRILVLSKSKTSSYVSNFSRL